MSQGIDFLICGLEHSGTTLATDLMRSKTCDSGFECGVLLSESPKEFINHKPFSKNILDGWKISPDELNECCQAENFKEFYDRLYFFSKLFDSKTITKRFDKTPRYVTALPKVHERYRVPTIVLLKDPRSITWSDFRRSKLSLEDINSWYEDWMPKKKRYMRSAYEGYQYAWNNPNDCLVIRLEDLCLSAKTNMQLIDEFIGVPFSHQQFLFSTKRYPHTRGNSIDISVSVSWMQAMPQEVQKQVMIDFAEFDRWFYEFD